MIELESISKTYNKGKSNEVKALQEISLRVEDGEMLAVTGPSGSGKSTLLYVLSFLEEADSGSYRLFGEDTGKLPERKKAALRNGSIGFVMQDYGLIPSLSAYKNVEIPLLIAGKGGAEVREKVREALKSVGLEEKIHERAGRLSGGQQQRVAIARSIVMDAKLILADEPTGALDSETSLSIMDLLCGLNEKGTTVIVATHDPLVAERCQRRIHLVDGRIAEDINR